MAVVSRRQRGAQPGRLSAVGRIVLALSLTAEGPQPGRLSAVGSMAVSGGPAVRSHSCMGASSQFLSIAADLFVMTRILHVLRRGREHRLSVPPTSDVPVVLPAAAQPRVFLRSESRHGLPFEN